MPGTLLGWWGWGGGYWGGNTGNGWPVESSFRWHVHPERKAAAPLLGSPQNNDGCPGSVLSIFQNLIGMI